MREVLHWLPASGHISYRVAELVWSCLSDCAPSYLYELACPVSGLLAQRSLFSSAGGETIGPASRRSSVRQNRAFLARDPPLGLGCHLRYACYLGAMHLQSYMYIP